MGSHTQQVCGMNSFIHLVYKLGSTKTFLNGSHKKKKKKKKKNLRKSSHGGLRTLIGHPVTGSVVLCAGFGFLCFFFFSI